MNQSQMQNTGGNMKRLPYRMLLLAACALIAAGCAQSNGDINRVQPNVMKKTDLLDGQWYFRNTVTWAPASTGFTFTGETGKMEKLVFEIQEHELIGYRAYPYIPGSETDIEKASKPSGITAKYCDHAGKCVGGHKYYGSPVVSYAIDGQFDIQRNYNPATGETGNVIQENASDRPWNEREYIRVNWSESGMNPGTDMSWGTVQNPAGATDVNAWIQANEPGTDPYDWPTQEFKKDADGNEKLSYFDFTGRYYAKPGTVYYDGYGDVPLCWLSPRYDCTANEIRMRTSLAKIDSNKTNDYEPLEYGNDMMTKFGFFRTERLSYNRKFGVTDLGVIYLANRYNIWKQTYEKDSNGAPDQTKPIPFAQREVKPIVYYVSPAARTAGLDTYKEYLESARQLQANWDVAFRRSVAAAQGKDVSQVPQMLYLCENPVPDTDTLTGQANDANSPCGAPGFAPKFGDLRYSFMYTITDPTPNGLLGYGPSSADPETGELISANANTYSGAVDTYAQYGLDMVDTLTGEKTIDQLVSGEDVRAYFAALENRNYASGNKALTMSPKNGLMVNAENQNPTRTGNIGKGPFFNPTSYMQSKLDMLKAGGGLPQSTQDRMKVAADMLAQNPSLESTLLDNPEMKNDILGMLPAAVADKAQTDPDAMRSALRNVMTNLPAFEALDKQRIEWASTHNVYLAEFLDRPLFGLAKREAKNRTDRMTELQGQGKSAYEARVIADNEIRRRFQQAIWKATSEHEIGHTFGLRHNFQGSFDAINYFDRYWEIKKPFLTVNQGGQNVLPATPNDLRAVSDATGSSATVLQNANASKAFDSIYDYEYSSIMDYGGKMNADWNGIGKYDEAAILFAYSGGSTPGYVEVFNQVRKTDVTEPGSDGQNYVLSGAGYDLPIVNAQHKTQAIPNYVERFHYSTIPLRFGEGADINAIIDSGISRLKSSNRKLMKWSEVKAAYDTIKSTIDSGGTPTAADVANIPSEVPYMFCTDDHVGYVLSCNRFDRGPDYFEMTRQWIEDYWNGYYFSHFRRDRYAFSADRAVNNSFNTFDSTSLVYKHWVHNLFESTNSSSQVLQKFTPDPLMQTTWSMAAFDGANEMLKVMSVPAAGEAGHVIAGGGQYAVGCNDCWFVFNSGDDFNYLNDKGLVNAWSIWDQYYGTDDHGHVPRGVGRKMYSRYDFRSGFGFWNRLVEVGHYYDQFGAMFAAVLPQATFLDTDDTADFRRYNVGYYLMFNQELASTFGSIWSNDEADRRPKLFKTGEKYSNGSDILNMAFQEKITPSKYIQNFNYKVERDTFTPAEAAAPSNVDTTWSARIYSIYLGLALFNVNYDQDYAKQNYVFRVGAGESLPTTTCTTGQPTGNCLPADYDLFQVTDVVSGATYAAAQPKALTVAGQTHVMGYYSDITVGNNDTPAVKMIKQAQYYLQVYNQTTDPHNKAVNLEQFSNQIRDLDLMRGMYAIYGKAF